MIARSLPVHWLRAVAVLGGLTLCATAWALSGKEMIDLRQAGIDSDTLALVVSEKVVESGTFSVGELVQMRQAGLSNETIATAVRAGAMDDRSPVIVYGRHVEPLQLGNIQDLLRLKAAGVDEKVIRALLVYPSDRFEKRQREESMELLKQMNLLIDRR